jgi:hypothetical protein
VVEYKPFHFEEALKKLDNVCDEVAATFTHHDIPWSPR